MKNKGLLYLLLFTLIINSYYFNSYAMEQLQKEKLYSISAAAIDGDSGRVLYEKNGYDERAMASTTKIMTLILALELGNPKDIVTVSCYAAKLPEVKLGIKKGESYYLSDLLYSLILESHNDSAVAIAEHIGQTEEGFAKLMNDKAKQLGLDNTYFITPNGLDKQDKKSFHHTTAVDLARLMKYCCYDSPKKNEFINISQTKSHSFTDIERKRFFSVNNKNIFLDMYKGVLSGKTGFTCDAGYCYVCAVTINNKNVVVAFLGAGWPNHKNYKWIDSRKLLDYILINYERKKIIDRNYYIPQVNVNKGIEAKKINPYVKNDVEALCFDNDKIEIRHNICKDISAPVKANEPIGKLDIYINNYKYKSIDIFSDITINKIDYNYTINILLKKIIHIK